MAFKDNKTVGEEVSNILRLAKVKFNESALKECGMDWQAPLDQQQEDRYNLTITTKDKTVTVNTTNPEDIIHLMKLGGMDVGSHTVAPAPVADIGFGSGELTGLGLPGMSGEPAAEGIPVQIDVLSDMGDEEGEEEHGDMDMGSDEEGDEGDEEAEDDEDEMKEESADWANTPAGSDGQQRSHGDIADQSAAGTGEGNKTYGQNKAPGQGDNPLAYESMMESYKQFKAESADMDKIPAYIRKAKGKSQEVAQKEIDKLNDKSGAKVWSSPRLPKGKTNEADMEEGNEFSGELAKAKASGKEEFEVDGKKYKVKEAAKPDFLDVDKDGDKKEPMKKAAKDMKAPQAKVSQHSLLKPTGKSKNGLSGQVPQDKEEDKKTNESAEQLAYMRKLAGLK